MQRCFLHFTVLSMKTDRRTSAIASIVVVVVIVVVSAATAVVVIIVVVVCVLTVQYNQLQASQSSSGVCQKASSALRKAAKWSK